MWSNTANDLEISIILQTTVVLNTILLRLFQGLFDV